jgi:hypothetical protein
MIDACCRPPWLPVGSAAAADWQSACAAAARNSCGGHKYFMSKVKDYRAAANIYKNHI